MADVTLAAAPSAVQTAVAALVPEIKPTFVSNHHSGLIQFNWDVAFHLSLKPGKATVTLSDPAGGQPGAVNVSSLDVDWGTLAVSLGIDLPTLTIGGFCIIPTPWGCLVRAPKITIFDGNPDITIPLDLSGWLVSTVSFSADLQIAPLTVGTDNYEAVYLDALHVDLEVVNIGKSVGNLLNLIVKAALAPLPSWAQDAIEFVVGPLDAWIAAALGIGQDIDNWLWNALGLGGLWDALTTMIANDLLHNHPLFKLKNPIKVDTHTSALKTVDIPLANVAATVTAAELLVTVNLEGPP